MSFGIYSTPKLTKYVALSQFRYKVIQRVPIDIYSSRFITNIPSFIVGNLFLG